MREVDLIVLGAGSGNSIPMPELADREIVVVDDGERFGGTCLNVGCIPTKMFIHPAEIAHELREARERFGADSAEASFDWRAIRDRVFGRIDAISEGGEAYRAGGEPNISLVRETVRLVGDREIETASGERIRGERILLGAGSRPRELEALPWGDRVHSNETIMRLEALPETIAVIGGGAIACEFAAMLAGLGAKVVQLHRSELLRGMDGDLRETFTVAARERWDLRLGVEVERAEELEDGLRLELSDGGSLEVERVLVAVGRIPNADRIGAGERGFDLRDSGALQVDDRQRVLRDGEPVEGVFAFGDLANEHQLKHVANHEARIAFANAARELDAAGGGAEAELEANELAPVPLVVFSTPQIASFGLTLDAAQEQGFDAVEARCDYGATAWGWALEDETSFAKLVVARGSGAILGAHIIGPDAGILIQPLVQAASFGMTVRGLARGQYWPHPAATEIIENALLRAEEQL